MRMVPAMRAIGRMAIRMEMVINPLQPPYHPTTPVKTYFGVSGILFLCTSVGKFWWGGANTGWRYEGQFNNGVENGKEQSGNLMALFI